MGLSKRAGFLVTGSELVEKALKKDTIKILFLADDISKKQADGLKRLASLKKVKIIEVLTETELSNAIGSKRKVIGITDLGIAKQIRELLED